MGTPFDIVKDSSIWYNARSLKTTFQLDSTLYTGTVKSVENDSETGELRYMVEIHHRGDTVPTACRMLRRFGGVFNYEDVVLRGYNYNTPSTIAAKAGDHVLVGLIGGQGREGVILGGMTHPTRKNLKKDNGPEYKSEFNGIETYINKEGEYTLTFKAQPTNLDDLNSAPTGVTPFPKYDTDVGGGFLKWDKTGSFTVSDSAKSNTQTLFINKPNGTFEIISGQASIKLNKNDQSTIVTSTDIRLGSQTAIEQGVFGTTYRTQEGTMNAQLSAQLLAWSIALASAGGMLTAAAVDPVFSGICPGAATKVSSAGGIIAAMAAQAAAMATAITTFEAAAPTYLSNVVKVG